MSKYTLELRYLYKDKKFKLFDFPYNLYDNDLKPWFEEKFFQHFMIYEIGFDSVAMFKQRLMSKLNDIFPYYKQLYETEIASKDIDFLLNKDLKESYVRELTSNSNSSQESNATSNGLSTAGQLTPSLISNSQKIDKFMDTAQKDESTSNSTATGESTGNSKEEYTLTSQGNIGITSSAELLDKWRQVLLNIDLMIFEECNDLFMQIF
ncbi:hypothetical protein [Methanobrevibacter sp.]|uniref:hypothetical protein n=1 Tax=Methanobrevibacter sp. TaxID=66852 RepID=UPI002E768FB3|nr:hypothetical protein [Methanobrevibacter sp.]MEE0025939.1 hypothetical protein [Methanobrevibacter sp.]